MLADIVLKKNKTHAVAVALKLSILAEGLLQSRLWTQIYLKINLLKLKENLDYTYYLPLDLCDFYMK